MFRAAETGDIRTVHYILGLSANKEHPKHINLDATSVKQWTALHYACYMGHLAVVEALLTSMQKLDVNSQTENGYTPLMLAADRGHIDIARLLIECGADIHVTNAKGKTAIYVAREREYHDIATFLTECSSSKREELDGMDLKASFRNQLFKFAEEGDATKLGVLLAHHFPVAPTDGEEGAEKAPPPAAEEKKGGEKLNLGITGIDNWTALHYAARKGHVAVVHALLTHSPETRKMLNIDSRTRNDWTPLMLAADRGHLLVVQLLLKLGANPRLVTQDGKTAFDLASENNHTEVAKLVEKAKLIILD